MKKITVCVFLMTLILSNGGVNILATQSVYTRNIDSLNDKKEREESPEIVENWGNTSGTIVPYRAGSSGTGQINIHFVAKNVGGKIGGYNGIYTLMLPEEFKEIAKKSGLDSKITGTIRTSTLYGEKTKSITPAKLEIKEDRINLKVTPNYSGEGEHISVDMKINYGALLQSSPNLKIQDNPDGYEFRSGVRFTNGSSDIIKTSLDKGEGSTWISEETRMLVADVPLTIISSEYRRGNNLIQGEYIGSGIVDSKVFLNGNDLGIKYDDTAFFKGDINIYVGEKLKDIDENDSVVIKCYDAKAKILDEVETRII